MGQFSLEYQIFFHVGSMGEYDVYISKYQNNARQLNSKLENYVKRVFFVFWKDFIQQEFPFDQTDIVMTDTCVYISHLPRPTNIQCHQKNITFVRLSSSRDDETHHI